MRRGPARDAACVPHATRRSRGTAKRSIDRQWVGRHPRPVMHSSPLDVLVQQSSRRASASLLRYTYSMPTPTPLCGDPRSVPQDNHVSNIRRRLFPVRDTECNSAVLRCLCASSAGNTSETTFALRVRCVTWEDDTQGAAGRSRREAGFTPRFPSVVGGGADHQTPGERRVLRSPSRGQALSSHATSLLQIPLFKDPEGKPHSRLPARSSARIDRTQSKARTLIPFVVQVKRGANVFLSLLGILSPHNLAPPENTGIPNFLPPSSAGHS